MALFADTGYYIALLVQSDNLHSKALAVTKELDEPIITTEWVLAELAGALSKVHWRSIASEFILSLYKTDGLTIIGSSSDLFMEGLKYDAQRLDKSWSLVDCISFICMQRSGISRALTADHYFEQVGFNALLR